jgi:hypothetical protein
MGSGEWRTENGRRHTGRSVGLLFVRKHPALALTLVYLAVTVVGRLDDLWYFQFFKINIFNYSAPEDFFLAPMRNPIVVIFLLVPALVILLFAWMRDKRTKSDAPATPAAQTSSLTSWWGHPLTRLTIGAAVVVATASALTQVHASRRSNEVKSGLGRRISFERTDGVNFGEQPLLLGSTGKFFFLYYPDRRVTEIVPVENTALMTVDSHARADSARGSVMPGISKQTSSLSP